MWKLDLNIEKTKIVIFSKSKKKESTRFMFGGDTLKISDTYSYLGIKLNTKATFQEAIKLLKEKGGKAMFLLTSSLYTGVTFQPDLPLKIFDNTVRPILTYGCEVWCGEYVKSLAKITSIDKAHFESVNNRFCKRIMGLPKQASNFGVKAELGRNIVFAYICAQAFKYWYKIVSMEDDRILKYAYYSELELYPLRGIHPGPHLSTNYSI